MRIFRSLAELDAQQRPSAITIGKFDGVHLGHRAIVSALQTVATERNLQTVVFTFETHPLSVINPERAPQPLASPAQRLEVLQDAGLDAAVMIPFDKQFSELTPREFVRDVLVGKLNCQYIIVGSDFRFGHGGAGNVAVLRTLGVEYDFEVQVVDDVIGDAGDRVSSTMIRSALAQGDVSHATELLGRYPRVTGQVVQGDQRGRDLGFPTANLGGALEGFVPADGVYAGWLHVGEQSFPTAVSIGTNPTFEGERDRRVEAYVLDQHIELYGERVSVDFVQLIRSTLTFESVDELITQMHIDVEQTREILAL